MKNPKTKMLLLGLVSFLTACSSFHEEPNVSLLEDHYTTVETQLPVINIEVDSDEFDNMYEHPDEEIEIEASFNLYRNKELVIEKEKVEIEIKGNFSSRFELKSLGIKFDDKYDNRNRSLINPDRLLPQHSIDKIKSIRLRNSGNDFKNTMLKDFSFTQLAINAKLDIELTYGEPSLVYINGDFYGLLNLRTESNTHGIAGLNGVSKSDLTMVKVTTHEVIKKDGDFDRVERLIQAISRKDINYLKSEIDLSNFTDYMIYESFLANTDWPHNNCRFYAIEQGKFRFVLFDLDKVSWLKMERDPITIIEDKNKPNIISDLFFALYEDPDFNTNFWNRFQELLDSAVLSPGPFKTIVDRNKENITTEIQMQIQKYRSPETTLEWEIEIDKMLSLFEERYEVVVGHLEGN